VAVQFVLAGGSFVLQVVAARALGAAGYGKYAVLYSILVVMTAIHTSLVGDSLTVFDRFDRRIRSALWICFLLSIMGGVVFALGASTVMTGVSIEAVVLFVTVTVLWLANETGRRIFAARMEFWRLAINDIAWYVATLASIAILAWQGITISLASILGAMCIGLMLAIILARVRLPRREYAFVSMRDAAVTEVLGFAGWRSVQAGLRPLTLFLARLLILVQAGPAVLGGIEAARLLMAPGITIINGSGWFLLGDFAIAQRTGQPVRTRRALRATGVLVAVTSVLGVISVASVTWLEPLLTADSFAVSRTALVGWAIYTVCFACTMPMGNLAAARRQSRLVFAIRGIETIIGLLALTALLAIAAELAPLAPYCLGAGGLASAAVLWSRLRRQDPAAASATPVDSGSADRSTDPEAGSDTRSAVARVSAQDDDRSDRATSAETSM
jgi:O-antigen/teichoic acid export membrane protein